jgi:hypothetical protein
LAQGVVAGIGSEMLAFNSVAIIPYYFTKRRMLAARVVSTGSSIGRVKSTFFVGDVRFRWLTRDVKLESSTS